MSEHSSTHHGTIGLAEAILQAGAKAWEPTLQAVGDKHEPFMVLTLEADGDQMNRYYRDISEVLGARAGGTYLMHNGTHCQLMVPTFVFEEQIRPMLQGREEVIAFKSGPKIHNSNEAMLRAALHDIFFDPGLTQWHDHQIMGEMRCSVNLHELAERGLHIDLDQLDRIAREEMIDSYGIGTLRTEVGPRGDASFTLPPHDFYVLQTAIAIEQRALAKGEDVRPTNVTTMRGWRDRQAAQAAQQQPDL